MTNATSRLGPAVAVLVLGLIGAAGQAEADLIIDQQNTVGAERLTASSTNQALSLGQSFTPTLSSIDFATFEVAVSENATYRIDLHSGVGYGGPLLGSSLSQALPVGSNNIQAVEFDFAAPIALSSGSTYTLQIVRVTGSNLDLYVEAGSGNPYTRGSFLGTVGIPFQTFDAVFSEGTGAVATPEPSTIALAASAIPVGLVTWLRRRRRAATA
jgi:hypothetical protein